MQVKLFLVLSFCAMLFFSCRKDNKPRIMNSITIKEINVDSSSIRAIVALKDSTLLFTTSDGFLGLVRDTMATKLMRIKYDTIVPHFRAMATNGTNTFILSIGNPALLYRFKEGESKLVYKEEHEKVFYDAMAFFDEKYGIAMGDPTEECLSIIITKDGGETWTKIPCKNLPKVVDGEAAFAASNGNISIVNDHVWVVTGGKRARVFHSPDRGKKWKVYDTPIIQGGKMTGIFSVDFFDEKNGIIFGGDWENKDNQFSNKAITKDGGKTWQLVADGQYPGYRSAVQYVPNSFGKELFAVGSTGISYSNDGGLSWRKVSNDGYYTIRFVNRNMAWLAGNNKIGKLILE
ncbi:MAG: oxidoreductase [Flavobacteriaceae bacterium]|nr:oxidoreductase [Flavobacteriaceae bacterium]